MTAPIEDDIRGSSPILSTKELVLDIWRDVKEMKPAVTTLVAANLPSRVEAIEDVQKAEAIAKQARADQRARVISVSNKTLAVVILCGNFVLGLWVAYANLATQGPHP